MNAHCREIGEELAALAEGKAAPQAEAHIRDCPSCAKRLAELKAVVDAARTSKFEAPDDLIRRAQALMAPSSRRMVARLLGNSLSGAGARGVVSEGAALRVGIGDLDLPLMVSPTRNGYEILGRAPSDVWTVEHQGMRTPCRPGGRFRIEVRELAESEFVLTGPEGEPEVIVPAVSELLDRGA